MFKIDISGEWTKQDKKTAHTAALSISRTTINAVLRSGANHNCHIYEAGI